MVEKFDPKIIKYLSEKLEQASSEVSDLDYRPRPSKEELENREIDIGVEKVITKNIQEAGKTIIRDDRASGRKKKYIQ